MVAPKQPLQGCPMVDVSRSLGASPSLQGLGESPKRGREVRTGG